MTESRARQRLATRARIAMAASKRFATLGYDRTSIRQIASDAQVDPALVMHYFGSKDRLYETVVGVVSSSEIAAPAITDPVGEALSSLNDKINEPDERTIAKLRSMLTHPSSTAAAKSAYERQAAELARGLDGLDAELRACLMLAINLGVAMARQILGVEPLSRVSSDEICALIRKSHDILAQPD